MTKWAAAFLFLCGVGRRRRERYPLDRRSRGRALQPSAHPPGGIHRNYRGSGIERTESGTLWLAKGGLKKPGKMRWEYRSPREKLFVSDGKDAWFYVPADRQARKTDARKLDDIRSPLAFLLGKSKLEKELRGLSLAPDMQPLQRRRCRCCEGFRRHWQSG